MIHPLYLYSLCLECYSDILQPDEELCFMAARSSLKLPELLPDFDCVKICVIRSYVTAVKLLTSQPGGL